MDKKKLLYAVPILVGGYLIFKQFTKAKATDKMDVPPPPQQGSTAEITEFPLKKGSRNDSVKTLQSVLNAELSKLGKPLLIVDGIFGAKTEEALKLVTGRTSVDSATDLSKLSSEAKAVSYISQNVNYGWDLVEKYNMGIYTSLVVSAPIKINKLTKTLSGGWKATTSQLNMPSKSYNLVDYALRSALNDGTLRIEITRGELAGMYATEPSTKLTETLSLR